MKLKELKFVVKQKPIGLKNLIKELIQWEANIIGSQELL